MISIVIPTFNESKNILILINDLITLLEDIDYEIVVVDDDSPDGTSEKVSQEMQNNSNIKLITRVGRSGLASAIKEGLLFARGEYLMVLDGDGQHEPFCVLEMMKEIAKEDCDLVIGSRFLESSKLDGLSERRSIGSQTANMISRLSLPRKYFHITDYLSGCFCLKKEKTKGYIRKIEINGFKILFELLSISRGSLKIKEIGLTFKERSHGTSKLDVSIVWDFLISILHNLLRRIIPRKAISFGLVGLTGVFVQLFTTLILTNIFYLEFKSALPFSIVIAATSNFLINNQLTFRSNRLRNLKLLKGLLKFLLVATLPILANIGIASAFYQFISPDTLFSQLSGIIIVYAWNYLASSTFVWNNSP